MKLNKIFFPLLFAVVLLFAQQGGAVHALHHAMAGQTQDQSLPHDKHCDLCAVYAQIGSAVAIGSIHFDFASSFNTSLSGYFTASRSVAFRAFAARAPPYFA